MTFYTSFRVLYKTNSLIPCVVNMKSSNDEEEEEGTTTTITCTCCNQIIKIETLLWNDTKDHRYDDDDFDQVNCSKTKHSSYEVTQTYRDERSCCLFGGFIVLIALSVLVFTCNLSFEKDSYRVFRVGDNNINNKVTLKPVFHTLPKNTTTTNIIHSTINHHTTQKTNTTSAVVIETVTTIPPPTPSSSSSVVVVDETEKWNILMVIQLSGEMGNHLSKIASGIGLATFLQTHSLDALNINIQLRHQVFHKISDQNENKWINSQQEIHECFPLTREWNFSEGNNDDNTNFIAKLKDDVTYNDDYMKRFMTLDSSMDVIDMLRTLSIYLQNTYQHEYEDLCRSSSNNNDTVTTTTGCSTSNSNSRNLFLYVDHLAGFDIMIDQYYESFRVLFEFDHENPNCCHLQPDPDEIVFHYRNYIREMPKKAVIFGFEELPAHFIHLALSNISNSSKKMAIVTRQFSSNDDDNNDQYVQPYVDTLRELGYVTRIIHNQTVMQDFCFLKSGSKELIGLARSTFFMWAAFLADHHHTEGNMVHAYSINSTSKREWVEKTGEPIFDQYNWSNNLLHKRFQFDLYEI